MKTQIPSPPPADAVAVSDSQSPSTADERQRDIATAAYYRSKARHQVPGFVPGNELEDWLEAERDMEALWAGRR